MLGVNEFTCIQYFPSLAKTFFVLAWCMGKGGLSLSFSITVLAYICIPMVLPLLLANLFLYGPVINTHLSQSIPKMSHIQFFLKIKIFFCEYTMKFKKMYTAC